MLGENFVPFTVGELNSVEFFQLFPEVDEHVSFGGDAEPFVGLPFEEFDELFFKLRFGLVGAFVVSFEFKPGDNSCVGGGSYNFVALWLFRVVWVFKGVQRRGAFVF